MKKLKDGTIRYRINEFSNMTGIPPAVIRYYESQGYPFPRREANGYRTFQVEDAYRLNMFRSIHARGFSVGESIALMQDTPRQELQDRLAENLNAMDLEIERLRQRRNWTEESLRPLELRAREPDAVWEEQLEETLYHPASIQDDYTIAQDNAAVRIAWDERVGMTRYVGICSGGDFAEGRPAGIDAGAAATMQSGSACRWTRPCAVCPWGGASASLRIPVTGSISGWNATRRCGVIWHSTICKPPVTSCSIT